jgi:hypothetical protein
MCRIARRDPNSSTPYHFGDQAFETRFTTTADQFCRRLAFSTLKTVASHSDRHAIGHQIRAREIRAAS